MAVTPAEFKVRFSEFSEVADADISPKLADASAFLDEGAWGTTDLYERAVYYYAAHLLAISPYGQQLQLVNDNGSTVYGEQFFVRMLPLIRRRGQISGGGLP